METTNRVYSWKDGDRLFVDVNGATIEAQALMFDRQIVTLQFRARVHPPGPESSIKDIAVRRLYDQDPLLDEGLW